MNSKNKNAVNNKNATDNKIAANNKSAVNKVLVTEAEMASAGRDQASIGRTTDGGQFYGSQAYEGQVYDDQSNDGRRRPNSLKIVVSADDYGFSQSITDQILKTHDQGALSSVSLIVNGQDFERAFEEIKKRPALRLSIHLNLIEGRSMTESGPAIESVPADKSALHPNSLNSSFGALATQYYFFYLFSPARRRALREALKREIELQLEAVKAKLYAVNRPLSIDSHQHVHLLPFIFSIILELNDQYHFDSIRTADEPFFFSFKDGGWKNYISSNLIKHVTLKALSRVARRRSRAAGIKTNDYFLGVLFSESVTADSILKGLQKIKKIIERSRRSHLYKMPKKGPVIDNNQKVVEILFHPGGIDRQKMSLAEAGFINQHSHFSHWYFSEKRKYEASVLCSNQLKEILKSFVSTDTESNRIMQSVFQVIKYIVSGSLAALVNLIIFFFTADILKIWFVYAIVISFIGAFAASFLLQRNWTFKNDRLVEAEQSDKSEIGHTPFSATGFKVRHQLVLHLLFALISVLVNIGLVTMLIHTYHLWDLAAQFISLAVISVVSFFTYKNFIFS